MMVRRAPRRLSSGHPAASGVGPPAGWGLGSLLLVGHAAVIRAGAMDRAAIRASRYLLGITLLAAALVGCGASVEREPDDADTLAEVASSPADAVLNVTFHSAALDRDLAY